MTIAPLQIPQVHIDSDITPQLSQMFDAINKGTERKTLADLGKGIADGTINYKQAAGTLASLGNPGGMMQMLSLAEAKDKLTKGQAASSQLYSGLGSLGSGLGIPGQQVTAAGPTVPNDSNAIPGTVGMNQRLADLSQDFLQDNPGTTMTSGFRSNADQARLYADRGNNPNPVAPPGSSPHERGLAIDIGGMSAEQRALLPQYGLAQPVAGDPPHVELARQPGRMQVASNDPSAPPVDAQATQGVMPSAANGFQGLNASHIPQLLRARANPYLPKDDKEFVDKLITRALDDSKPSDKIKTLQALKQQSGYQGSILDLEKELRAASKPQVTVDQRGETEEAKAAGKGAGERRAAMFASAGAASKTLMNLSRIDGLLGQVSQGKLEPARMNISAWAKAFGLNDDVAKSLGLDPKGVGSAQALNALTNEMVVGKIGSGAFPANNFSDADREFLLGTVQRLGNDPRANKIITETARRMAQLDIDRARAYQQFKANPANKSKGFEDFELQWFHDIAKKDVFGDLRKQAEAIIGAPRNDIGETLNNPGPAPSRGASGTWGGASAPQSLSGGWQDLGGGVRIRERR